MTLILRMLTGNCFILSRLFLSIFTTGCLSATYVGAQKTKVPNIIYIQADDLGWSEPGCFGNRFNETPALDLLAKNGIRFTQAYAASEP